LTPSEAATRVVPDRLELHNQLCDLEGRLRESVRQRLAVTRERLDDLAGRRVLRFPLEQVHAQEQRLDGWDERLKRALRQRIGQSRERIIAQAAQLESLSPLNVLRRGYSLTRREEDQAVVRNPAQVQPGDRLLTTVQHGLIVSRVEELPVTNPIAVP
jgi:exodeoxyribonuclease VII large subunit